MPMKLNRNGDDFIAIEKWLNEQIADMREKNDSDLDVEETAKIRGKIEFAKEVLALGDKDILPEHVGNTEYVN